MALTNTVFIFLISCGLIIPIGLVIVLVRSVKNDPRRPRQQGDPLAPGSTNYYPVTNEPTTPTMSSEPGAGHAEDHGHGHSGDVAPGYHEGGGDGGGGGSSWGSDSGSSGGDSGGGDSGGGGGSSD